MIYDLLHINHTASLNRSRHRLYRPPPSKFLSRYFRRWHQCFDLFLTILEIRTFLGALESSFFALAASSAKQGCLTFLLDSHILGSAEMISLRRSIKRSSDHDGSLLSVSLQLVVRFFAEGFLFLSTLGLVL